MSIPYTYRMNSERSKLLSSNEAWLEDDVDPVWHGSLTCDVSDSEGISDYSTDIDQDQIYICPPLKVYMRRWHILILFTMAGTVTEFATATWGPLADSMEEVLGWTTDSIALLLTWPRIAFILVMLLYWRLNYTGLRLSAVLASSLVVLGTALKCIPATGSVSTRLIHVSQVVTSLGVPFYSISVPMISALWFPLKERTTATAIAASAQLLGPMLADLVGPQFVRDRSTNASDIVVNVSTTGREDTMQQVVYLSYLQVGLALVALVCTLAYFPKSPPLPPTVSATITRLDIRAGLRYLLPMGQFWLIASAYGLLKFQISLLIRYVNALPVIAGIITLSPIDAYILMLQFAVIGVPASVVLAILVDACLVRPKHVVTGISGCGLLLSVPLALMLTGVVPIIRPLLYITCLLEAACLVAPLPVLIELMCEVTFPVDEGMTVGVAIWMVALLETILNLISMIIVVGVLWVPWMGIGVTLLATTFIAAAKQVSSRRDLDVRTGPRTNTRRAGNTR